MRDRSGFWVCGHIVGSYIVDGSQPGFLHIRLSNQTHVWDSIISVNTRSGASSSMFFFPTFLFHSCIFLCLGVCARAMSSITPACICPYAKLKAGQGVCAGFVFGSRWACHNRIEYFRGPWHSIGPLLSFSCLVKGPPSTYSWDAGWSNYLASEVCTCAALPMCILC